MRARGFRVESICRVLCEHGVQVVEYATMEWVDGFNNRRLHSLLDYVPPEEHETAYYAQLRASQRACLKHEAGMKPGTVQVRTADRLLADLDSTRSSDAKLRVQTH
jgi:hypothetical protein